MRGRKGASTGEAGILIGLIAVLSVASILSLGEKATGVFFTSGGSLDRALGGAPVAPPEESTIRASCKAILDAGESVGDGIYRIDPNGNDTFDAFEVRCDMSSDGGGWTLIAAQFEEDPAAGWNEGIQSDYDPTLASARGFALDDLRIPAHSQTAFGKDTSATFVDYGDFTYSTGSIPRTSFMGLKMGTVYQIYRSPTTFYDYHDPEQPERPMSSSSTDWTETLAIDRIGGTHFDWAYSPRADDPFYRGFAMKSNVYTVANVFAWTLWVR